MLQHSVLELENTKQEYQKKQEEQEAKERKKNVGRKKWQQQFQRRKSGELG